MSGPHLETPTAAERTKPPRLIGGLASFSVVAGSMLGIGIFIGPPVAARHVDSPLLFLGIWALAGLFAFAGAVAYGELGAMMPRAGGDYVFQRAAFGRSVAFASGWLLFAAIFTGSIASMSVAVAQYQLPVLFGRPLDQVAFTLPWTDQGITEAHLVAIGLVLLLTVMNWVGVKLSAAAQELLTIVPIVLLALGALYLIIASPDVAASPSPAITEPVPLTAAGIVLAYMGGVYFAFSGWPAVIYVAGEVKKPGRNIPLGLLSGTLTVTVLYVLMCVAFLVVLGMPGLREAGEAGSATAGLVAGEAGRFFITGVIAIALFASLNGTVLGGARVAYAMAHDGAFVRYFGGLNGFGVPGRALWLQALLACCFIVFQSFEQILMTVSLAMVLTGSLTVAALFVMRWRAPTAERPYRATGYPWLPALYLLSSVFVIVMMVDGAVGSDDRGAWYPLLGLGILAVAFVGHLIWKSRIARTVAVALVCGIGLFLLVTRSARAVTPQELATLERSAAAAASSEESASLHRLYELLTCAREKPELEVADYPTYCNRLREYLQTYRERFRDVAGPWIAKRRPADLPPVVLYPFSGADLVSSVLAFPDARLHVHISLEHGGPVDALETVNPGTRWLALLRLLDSSRGLLNMGDSKTEDLRLAHKEILPGKLPITLVGLAAHEAEVVSIRYLEVRDDGSIHYFAPGEELGRRPTVGHAAPFDARNSDFELAFRLPGSPELRVMRHLAADLSNDGLWRKDKSGEKVKSGVLRLIEGLGDVTFMTKAATYLLRSPDFTTIRDVAIHQARWMISDASGVLPWQLPAKKWKTEAYGRYDCMLLNWVEAGGHWKASDDRMATWFKEHAVGNLSFRFGYIDCHGNNSVVIAARR